MSKNEMKKIREMRTLAEKVFLGELKQEEIVFKNEEDIKWFNFALSGLQSDKFQ